MEKSMKDQFSMFDLWTCAGSRNAISSPELPAGPTPCASPGGLTTAPSGLEVHRASLSALPVPEKGVTMKDTWPPILSNWSGPAAPECCLASKSPVRLSSERLQSALEKRLVERLNGRGSMIYSTAWKPHITPAGRAISRLRASALRTSGNGPSSEPSPTNGWNTPRATDGSNGGPNQANGALASDAALAGCPTPQAGNSGSETHNATVSTDSSRKTEALCGKEVAGHGIADLSGWATASARDWKDTGKDLSPRADGTPRLDQLPRQANLAGWPTPTSSDGSGGGQAARAMNPARSNDLHDFAQLLRDHPQPARITSRGEMLTGSSAGMESGGQLSPAMSAYLMGYPMTWCEAAISAFKAKPKRRRAK